MINESEKIWKEAVVVEFKVLSQYVLEEIDENREKPSSG
jgi:hypothetical protein